MKGVVRKIDPLGRLVIPIEVRRELGWQENEPVEILVEGKQVTVKKYEASCIMCGRIDDIKKIKGKNLCNNCITDIKETT